jgi:hypothetical protein
MTIKKYYVVVDERSTRWYKDAKCKVLHRENAPAVEYANGSRIWCQNGQRHRIDGPAIEWWDGDKRWWQNGQRHRTDGPAIERNDGSMEWYINDEELTEAEFLAATQPVIDMTVADIEKLVGKRVKIIK